MGTRYDRWSDLHHAYLCAFSAGDLHVYSHGRKVRVEASTTHPAQISLISALFGEHARRIMYPMETPEGFAWRIVYDLPTSFDFLLQSRVRTYRALQSTRTFYIAVSGLVDSEGHIGVGGSKGYTSARLTIANSDIDVIKIVSEQLTQRGYRPGASTKIFADGTRCYEVRLNGKSAIRLLKRLKLRHPEKIEARRIALLSEKNSIEAGDSYVAHRLRIRGERSICVNEAQVAFEHRGERREHRREAFRALIERASELRLEGHSIAETGTTLGRSERTVYRLLRRSRDGKGTTQKTE